MNTLGKSTIWIATLTGLVFTAGFTCRVGGSGNDGGVFKSANRGESWEQKTYVDTVKKKEVRIDAVDSRGLVFDPMNPSVLYLATSNDGLYKTVNGGDQWTRTGLNEGNITSVSVHPTETNTIFATIGRSLYRSSDGGTGWSLVYTSAQADNALYNVVIDPFTPNQVYLSDALGGIFKSLDQGETWQSLHRFAKPVTFIRINPQDARRVYVAIDGGGLFLSSDGGLSWNDLSESLKDFKNAKLIQALTFVPQNSDWIYLGTTYGLLRSTDAGQTWQAIKTLTANNTQPIRMVAVDPLNANRVYYSSNSILYRSDDNGQNWKPLRTLPTKRVIQQVLIHPTQTDILYAGLITLK